MTATPPHTGRSTAPTPTVALTPVADVTCSVIDHSPAIIATVTQDEAGNGPEDFYVVEFNAAGTRYAQITMRVPAPLVLGTLASVIGPADPSLASCMVTGVSGNGG